MVKIRPELVALSSMRLGGLIRLLDKLRLIHLPAGRARVAFCCRPSAYRLFAACILSSEPREETVGATSGNWGSQKECLPR